MSVSEAMSVLDAVPASSERLIMVGVLASQKTVFLGLENKWPNRYPSSSDISSIFPKHPLALNLIHYNTKEPETLLEQMLGVTKISGSCFHGFQLNVAWPSPKALEAYRQIHGGVKIVLQVGSSAFRKIGNSPVNLARKVMDEYDGLVDYLLLDPSGGLGEPFNTALAREYLEELRGQGAERFLGLGVAGGLSPTTLNLVEPLARAFPKLCIDAEGRLRDENDTLDLSVAREYVSKAMRTFID